jgi:hypothetical protein
LVDEVPDSCLTVHLHAVIVKSVHLIHLAGFVIAAQEVEIGGISDLQIGEIGECFDRGIATIDVIAEK